MFDPGVEPITNASNYSCFLRKRYGINNERTENQLFWQVQTFTIPDFCAGSR
jgi:hypothetical protein